MREQPIPLRAVGGELGPVVDALPELLNIDNTFAYCGSGTGLLLEILGCGEMIGVRMGVEDPLDRQVILLDVVEDRVGIDGASGSRLLIEIENGIDYLLYALEDVIFDRPDSKRTLHWKKISDELFNERNKLKFLYDSPDLDLSPYHFVKLLLPYISDENAEKIRERYGKDGRYEICFSEKSVLDITPSGITKAFAVETLARLYGFDLRNALVLGDNFNDESMLKVCGYPVVPENGEEEMKKLARYITTDNDHSPLTHAVKALFPELL